MGILISPNPAKRGRTDPKRRFDAKNSMTFLKTEFVRESYARFEKRLRIRGQNGKKVGKICDGG